MVIWKVLPDTAMKNRRWPLFGNQSINTREGSPVHHHWRGVKQKYLFHLQLESVWPFFCTYEVYIEGVASAESYVVPYSEMRSTCFVVRHLKMTIDCVQPLTRKDVRSPSVFIFSDCFDTGMWWALCSLWSTSSSCLRWLSSFLSLLDRIG